MPERLERDYAIKNEKETIEVETVKKLVASYFNVVSWKAAIFFLSLDCL